MRKVIRKVEKSDQKRLRSQYAQTYMLPPGVILELQTVGVLPADLPPIREVRDEDDDFLMRYRRMFGLYSVIRNGLAAYSPRERRRLAEPEPDRAPAWERYVAGHYEEVYRGGLRIEIPEHTKFIYGIITERWGVMLTPDIRAAVNRIRRAAAKRVIREQHKWVWP